MHGVAGAFRTMTNSPPPSNDSPEPLGTVGRRLGRPGVWPPIPRSAALDGAMDSVPHTCYLCYSVPLCFAFDSRVLVDPLSALRASCSLLCTIRNDAKPVAGVLGMDLPGIHNQGFTMGRLSQSPNGDIAASVGDRTRDSCPRVLFF